MRLQKNTQTSELYSEQSLTDLVRSYEPLMNKIVKQFYSKNKTPWEELKSYAYEGLILATRKYDSNKSKMTFTQYAAYAIRNNILNSLTNDSRLVRMNAYQLGKAKEEERSTFTTTSMSTISGETGPDEVSREYKYGLYENASFSEENIFDYIYNLLKSRYNDRDLDIFYSYYGINADQPETLVEISSRIGISCSRTSQIIKRMINYLKKCDLNVI